MDEIGRLIKLAGAREAVPDDRFARARQKVRSHWEQVVAEQRATERPQRIRILALAASAAVVFAGAAYLFWNLSFIPRVDYLADVDRVLGKVLIAGEVAGENSVITAGSSIMTDINGRIALRMSGGQSLRIDSASHVTLHSTNHVSLETGAIYIDSESAEKDDPILISTPLGTAQDIGTQFQVRISGMKLVVGVRQGLVEVAQPGQQSLSIDKGHYVELVASGESRKRPLEQDDPDWEWIETVAPEFDIQGASLEQYLRWYAREQGLNLVWADKKSENNAAAALLSGSISGTGLDESLLIVQQIAPFEYRVSGEIIRVKIE